MAYGLLAALSWGAAGFGAALAARRIGAFRTVVIGEVAALTGFVLLFVLGPFSLRGTGPVAWLLVLAGVIGLGGYLALYRGLESGHVGLVSAISASYAGVTVILSVLVLGEHLTGAAAGGVVLTVTGVTLASSRAGRANPGARETARATGVAFGLAAALCYGVGGFLLGRYTREFGWLVPVVVARVGAMAVLLALLATPLRRSAVSQRGLGIAWAVGVGLVDAAGVAFFARGDQVGLISITAASSSAYPIIPLLGGLVLLHERIARWQAVGVVLILAGLVLLGAGS
jgi:drug/metabolite transporter (DMT)-like permease